MSERVKLRMGPAEVVMSHNPDGTIIVKSPHDLAPYPRSITDRLDHWARVAPDRIFLAQRDAAGAWRNITYSGARSIVRNIAQALIGRGLSPERPVAILSGNGLEHAMLGLGAVYAGIPYAAISPAYSLIARDLSKLRGIIELLQPGMVFAADGAQFRRAIGEAVPAGAEVVVSRNPPSVRQCTDLDSLWNKTAGPEVDAANAKIGPDTVAKILFTSGSTGVPKGVINTQRMMTSNQVMMETAFPSFSETPPVLVDWLPWSHTFGGNHNFNMALFHGGTMFVDDGKPLPGAFDETVHNLREIAPTVYFNVPKAFEMLLPHLRAEPALRNTLFSRLQCFFYAGAALSPHVKAELETMALETTGLPIPMVTSLGSTETAPSATTVTDKANGPGVIGIPNVGVEMKLVPNAGKLEVRLKGANITTGYWRQPELTKAAFDDQGYYLLGDALRFVDESEPEKGFIFDGRVAEDFKLGTGTWVSVGPLRARLITHFAPLMRDVVIAGQDRAEVTALVVPDVTECLALVPGLDAETAPAQVLAHAAVRARCSELLGAFNKIAGGSSMQVTRLILMAEPPSLDLGEMTDKGSLNQRAVLANRKDLVEDLYAAHPPAHVIEAS
jgi:feruloyl-CoA synthase